MPQWVCEAKRARAWRAAETAGTAAAPAAAAGRGAWGPAEKKGTTEKEWHKFRRILRLSGILAAILLNLSCAVLELARIILHLGEANISLVAETFAGSVSSTADDAAADVGATSRDDTATLVQLGNTLGGKCWEKFDDVLFRILEWTTVQWQHFKSCGLYPLVI